MRIPAGLVLVSVAVIAPAVGQWTTSAPADLALAFVDGPGRMDEGPRSKVRDGGADDDGAGAWSSTVGRYADGPPQGHTGGFDEPTCRRCHFDQAINDPSTRLVVEGVPAEYVAGRRYRITLALHRDGLGRGGFQMAARFTGPPQAGRQAGSFHASSDRIQVLHNDSTGVEYIQQTLAGSVPTRAPRVIWSFDWQAPVRSDGMIVFHLAANAANNDASEFGDFIVVRRLFASPVGN